IAAANGMNVATTPTATVVVDLGGQTIQDTTVNVPPQVTLTFVNGTFVGGSPALVVTSGSVFISNSLFVNATDAPTILVTGASLTGTDGLGAAVRRVTQSVPNGVYSFTGLRPSNSAGYTITATQPTGLLEGIDAVGKVNGVGSGNSAVQDVFSGVNLSAAGAA